MFTAKEQAEIILLCVFTLLANTLNNSCDPAFDAVLFLTNCIICCKIKTGKKRNRKINISTRIRVHDSELFVKIAFDPM